MNNALNRIQNRLMAVASGQDRADLGEVSS